MATTPVPYSSPGSALAQTRSPRLTRDLARLERQTLVRMARVQAEGFVQTEKLHEIDHLAREAMSGQAMLQQWGSALAAGDPFISDELRFFTDIAKLGKGEVIADTISTFCRESRR
jgi:hypothetical protein